MPLTAVEEEQLAAEEGLTLMRTSRLQIGFKGVSTTRSGRFNATRNASEYLGATATAEEAALLYARHLGPEASAAAAAAAVPLTAMEAEQLAAEEGLTLVRMAERQKQAAAEQKRLFKEAQQRLFQEAATQQRAQEAAQCPNGHAEVTPGAPPPAEQSVDILIAVALASGHCAYTRLGVPIHAPWEACRKNYLQLALKLHPDKGAHPDAKEAFAAVESAKKVRKQVPMAAQARPPASISPLARAPLAGGDRAPFCARSIS